MSPFASAEEPAILLLEPVELTRGDSTSRARTTNVQRSYSDLVAWN
jgi:hypothetical protein